MEVKENLTENKQNEKILDENVDKNSRLSNILCTIVIICCLSVLSVQFINKYICFKAYVIGSSMENTYFEGDEVYVWKILKIQRGDIVVYKNPNDNKVVIKRCIGIPGDTVVIKDDGVYVNNEKISEPYLKDDYIKYKGLLSEEITLGSDEYILLGDNRNNSQDSRVYGIVNKNDIYGKVK